MYLLPNQRAALDEIDLFVSLRSRRKLTIEKIIDSLKPRTPLFIACSRLVGYTMRKHIDDNPNRSTHTRIGKLSLQHDLQNAKWLVGIFIDNFHMEPDYIKIR